MSWKNIQNQEVRGKKKVECNLRIMSKQLYNKPFVSCLSLATVFSNFHKVNILEKK